MFNPSQDDVRRFFCGVQAKAQAQAPMDALETLAGQWLAEHPEYEADLADAEAAVAKVKAAGHATDEFVHANPWKSISMAAGLGVILGLIASRR